MRRQRIVPPPQAKQAGGPTSERQRIINRLRSLAGSRFTSAKGITGVIRQIGLERVEGGHMVLYETMTEDQLREVVRANEEFIQYADDRVLSREEGVAFRRWLRTTVEEATK